VFPDGLRFDPSGRRVFDFWITAQLELARGEQPAICIAHGAMLRNVQRVRAPTNQRTIQQHIDRNTQIRARPNALAAGDWTDDEEEEIDDDTMGWNRNPMASASRPRHQKNTQSVSALCFQPPPNRPHAYHRQQQWQPPPPPLLPRAVSNDGALRRRQQKLKNRRKQQSGPTVAALWFEAQSQLRAGRNPTILSKFHLSLSNIRQHNPRFRDYQRRRSQHEKAATYLQLTNDTLRGHRMRALIANDDDDDEDELTETEESLSSGFER